MIPPPPKSTLFPYTTLFRSISKKIANEQLAEKFIRKHFFDKMEESERKEFATWREKYGKEEGELEKQLAVNMVKSRSEEHTSELQSQSNLVCRLLLEKKKKK